MFLIFFVFFFEEYRENLQLDYVNFSDFEKLWFHRQYEALCHPEEGIQQAKIFSRENFIPKTLRIQILIVFSHCGQGEKSYLIFLLHVRWLLAHL